MTLSSSSTNNTSIQHRHYSLERQIHGISFVNDPIITDHLSRKDAFHHGQGSREWISRLGRGKHWNPGSLKRREWGDGVGRGSSASERPNTETDNTKKVGDGTVKGLGLDYQPVQPREGVALFLQRRRRQRKGFLSSSCDRRFSTINSR